MKKSLVMLLVVSFVLGLAGTALAFPVDFSGSVSIGMANWQDKVGDNSSAATNNSERNYNDFRSNIKLNFSAQVDQDVTLFGRFAERTQSGLSQKDPEKDLLDQFGVKIANNGWNYSVGRQGVSLGQSTIIGTGNGVGFDAKFDGVVAAGKLGAVDTKFVVGRTTPSGYDSYNYLQAATKQTVDSDDVVTPGKPNIPAVNGHVSFSRDAKNVWGLDFSTPVASNLTLGATFASIDTINSTTEAAKYIGVNATFNPSANLTLNGEYVKSNADNYNKAYFIAGTYSWDKDWFSIQYQNVGIYGADVNVSGIGAWVYPYEGDNLLNDTKYTGFTYDYNHQLSKAAALNICYMTLKTPNQDGNDNEYGASVTWSF